MLKLKNLLSTIIIGFSIAIGTINVYANGEDNATSGGGDVGSAMDGKAYYIGSEYMYKVSVYVAKGDTVNETHDLSGNWYKIGNEPIFIRPNTYTLPNNLWATPYNKYDYNNGAYFDYYMLTETLIDNNTPPPPIVSDGNLSDVKYFFGSETTLDMILQEYANIGGTTIEGLVSDLQFHIDDEWDYQDPSDILADYNPIVEQWRNKVSWLVMYEPLAILHLKPDNNGYRQPVAFTATELAILQKEGMLDFFYQPYSQFVASYSHKALPNSVVLEHDWIGLQAYTPLPEYQFWSDDRIIAGGGIGMRMFRGNPDGLEINNDGDGYNPIDPVDPDGNGNGGGSTDPTNPDGGNGNGGGTDFTPTYGEFEYRTNTEVITSFKIRANDNIFPDDREQGFETSEAGSPLESFSDTNAYVTIDIEGYGTYTEAVSLPSGDSTYVWVKWTTPNHETTIPIRVYVENNSNAEIVGYGNSAYIDATIVNMNKNIPPDPQPHDKMPYGFIAPNPPRSEEQMLSASWETYEVEWIPDIVEDYEWDYTWKSKYVWDEDLQDWVKKRYKDWYKDYFWEDHGYWEYTVYNFNASLTADMTIKPSRRVMTANQDHTDTWEMKSGYGIEIDVVTDVSSNGDVTRPQNVVTYFPEFYYKDYWRLLEENARGVFNFQFNKYSTAGLPAHYTPLAYPDDDYEVYGVVIDAWTPAGMLRANLADLIEINGDLYDDWQITHDFPDE